MSEIPENTGEIQGNRNLDGTFKEGMSGNPAGKPKGSRSFTTKVREALEKIAEGKDYTYEEAFIKAILKKSIVDQDVGMMRTVWEQLDGKPMQRIEHTGKDGENLMQNSQDLDKLAEEVSQRLKEKKLNDTSTRTA